MSFSDALSGAPWERFGARSALVLGLAGLALTALFLVVLGLDPSDPYAELVVAGRNPAAYRLAAFLDMLVWVGSGVLLAFAGYFAVRAPIRAILLAALGAGQVVGALGGALRLGAIGELATRYAAAAPDQQVALGQTYLTLAQVIGSHYGAGQWLYGIGYVFLAGLWDTLQRQARLAATGVVAAGVTLAGMGLVLYSARQAIAMNATQIQDPAVVQTIRDFSNTLETFSTLPLAVLVGLTSWGLLGGRGGARWIGRVGLAISVRLIGAGTGAIVAFLRPLGAVAFLVSSLWVVVVAITLVFGGLQARGAASVP